MEDFLKRVRDTEKNIRLHLDCHLSVAFLVGSMFGFKTKTHVELNQKGRGPTTVWRSDDEKVGPRAAASVIDVGKGDDVGLVVSFSRNAFDDVRRYVEASQPTIGRLLHVSPANGTGQKSLAGGEHAAELADQIADEIKAMRVPIGARVHIFIAAPNAFTFFLGQHRDSIGAVTLYEFDFQRAVDGSYHPSFRIG